MEEDCGYLEKKVFEADNSKLELVISPPKTLTLKLQEFGGFHKHYHIVLQVTREGESILFEYEAYGSTDKEEARETYDNYLEALESGNYKIRINPFSSKAEFIIG